MSITKAQMERAEELAFRRGFDAGVEHQRKAAPPPKARQLAKQLAAVTAERDELLAALKDYIAHMAGRPKSCGHEFECVCVGDKALAAIAKAEGGR